MAATNKILVTYGERRKILSIPEGDGIDSVRREFLEAFDVNNCDARVTFQRYDSEFEEYVDIDDGAEVFNKEKLVAVVTFSESSFHSVVSAASSFVPSGSVASGSVASGSVASGSVASGSVASRSITSSPSPIPSCRTCKRQLSDSADEEEELEHSEMKGSETEDGEMNESGTTLDSAPAVKKVKSKILKSDADKIPLPDPFPLPQHFSHHLEVALASGKLSKKEKQSFISEVASFMLRFKRYPDRDDYICVVRAIITKYPFLKQHNGNPYDVLVRTLMNRFKEFRREKKAKLTPSTPKGADLLPIIKQKSPGITMMPSEPRPLPGEDNISYERHLKTLQIQYKKTHRNKAVVKELMERSFAFRRAEIMDKCPSLENVFDKFPFLQEIETLMMEMQLIMNDNTLQSKAKERWSLKIVNILEEAKLEAQRNTGRLSAFFTKMDIDADIPEGVNDSLCALMVLPLLLPDVRIKADPSKIIYCAEECVNINSVVEEVPFLTPYILLAGSLHDPEQAFLVVDKKSC